MHTVTLEEGDIIVVSGTKYGKLHRSRRSSSASSLVARCGGALSRSGILNYVYGCPTDILSDAESPDFVRTGQDFARRLVWDQDRFATYEMGSAAFVGDDAIPVLAALLKCLQLTVSRSQIDELGSGALLSVYQGTVHWDARNWRTNPRGKAQVERRYFAAVARLAHELCEVIPTTIGAKPFALVFGMNCRMTGRHRLTDWPRRCRGMERRPAPRTDSIETEARPREDATGQQLPRWHS